MWPHISFHLLQNDTCIFTMLLNIAQSKEKKIHLQNCIILHFPRRRNYHQNDIAIHKLLNSIMSIAIESSINRLCINIQLPRFVQYTPPSVWSADEVYMTLVFNSIDSIPLIETLTVSIL